MALLALAAGSPARAQNGWPAAPVPSRPKFDEPPPLDLGTPPRPQASPLEADRKAQVEAGKARINPWGPYELAVVQVLLKIREIREASFNAQLQLWIDASGHATRAELVPPTGDAGFNVRLRKEILALTLPAAPHDMPMPFKIQIGRPPK